MLGEIDEANVAQRVVVVQECGGKHRTQLQLLALQTDLLMVNLQYSIHRSIIRAARIRLHWGQSKVQMHKVQFCTRISALLCNFSVYIEIMVCRI